jgi:predicted acyl esterase
MGRRGTGARRWVGALAVAAAGLATTASTAVGAAGATPAPAPAVAAPAVAAPAQAAERICDEELVRASDGARLHTWVSRPAPDGPRPVLLEFESYNGPGDECPAYLPQGYYPSFLSPEVIDRFTLVHVSYRGTGSSEGRFDMTGPTTQRDVREVIAWAAEQPWSDGRVVLTGQSGTGFAAHHGLREDPVVGAVIYSSCADMYRCMRRGGIYNGLGEVYLGRTEAGWAFGLPSRLRLGTALAPDPVSQQAAIAGALVRTKTELTNTGWWAERSALDRLDEVDVPVMYTTDAYDIVGSYDAYLRTPGSRLVLGMGHSTVDAIENNPERHAALVRSQVDRFVANVLGDDNGAEDDPEVVVMTNTGSVEAWRSGRTLVRGEDAWPLPGTDWTRLHLGAGPTGTATSLADGSLDAATPAPPAAGAHTSLALSSPDLRADMRTTSWLLGGLVPGDLRGDELRALTYTTPALQEDLELTGPITLRLVATSTAPDLDWGVRLTDVHPDGRSEWITDGYLRASLRAVDPERSLRDEDGEIVRPFHPFTAREPVPAGEPVEYLIELVPTSNVFAAGHRLRLDVLPIAGGGLDSLVTGGVGVVEVLRGPGGSSLTLPVIPDRCGEGEPLREGDAAPAGCAESYADALDP